MRFADRFRWAGQVRPAIALIVLSSLSAATAQNKAHRTVAATPSHRPVSALKVLLNTPWTCYAYYDPSVRGGPEGTWDLDGGVTFHVDGTFSGPDTDPEQAPYYTYKVEGNVVTLSYQRTKTDFDLTNLAMDGSGKLMKGTDSDKGIVTCKPGADPEKVELGRRWTFINGASHPLVVAIIDLPGTELSGQGMSDCEATTFSDSTHTMRRSDLFFREFKPGEKRTVACGPAFALCVQTYQLDEHQRLVGDLSPWTALKCQEENAIWAKSMNSRSTELH